MARTVTIVERGEVTLDTGETATFEVTNNRPRMVRVSSEFGTKSTQLGSTPARSLARLLLLEMIAEGKSVR